MSFDFDRFENEKYIRRTDTLLLENFGGSDDTQEWEIQNLTAEDLAEVEAAIEKNQSLSAIIDTAVKASQTDKIMEKIESIKAVLGITDKTRDTLIRKYLVFELGSVSPKPKSRQHTIKFAAVHPIEFNRICNSILVLTGKGGMIAKKKP